MDLAAPDLVDVHRGQVEGVEVHLADLATRVVDDGVFLLRHRMMEMREAEREARELIGDIHSAMIDGVDVRHRLRVELALAVLHADEARRTRRRAGNARAGDGSPEGRSTHAVLAALAVGRERGE